MAWLPTSSWALGLLLFAAASIMSIQIGRGVLWPGKPGLFPRLLLLALNVFALIVTFETLQQVRYAIEGRVYDEFSRYGQATPTQGLSFNGVPLSNVYPYDAAGNPLIGVQLVDDEGRRLKVDVDSLSMHGHEDRVLSPWLNGRTPLLSVFPLPEQARDMNTWEVLGEPALQAPPFAVLPPVTLEGVTPTTTSPQEESVEKRKAAAKKRGR